MVSTYSHCTPWLCLWADYWLTIWTRNILVHESLGLTSQTAIRNQQDIVRSIWRNTCTNSAICYVFNTKLGQTSPPPDKYPPRQSPPWDRQTQGHTPAHKLNLRHLFLHIFPPTHGTPAFKRHYKNLPTFVIHYNAVKRTFYIHSQTVCDRDFSEQMCEPVNRGEKRGELS